MRIETCMKPLLFLIIFVLSDSGYGQTAELKLDTLKMSGDTCYLKISLVENEVLTLQEERISVDHSKHLILHGESQYWYPSGAKKAQCEYTNGVRQEGAICWDPDGNQINCNWNRDAKNFEEAYFYWDGIKYYLPQTINK